MDAPFVVDAGLTGLLGVVFDAIGPELVTAHLVVEERHLQPFGLVHGGVYSAIAETLASVGASVSAQDRDPTQGAVGLENHTSFLRGAGVGTTVRAEATSRHGGRRVQLWTVVMRDGDGRELALSTVRLLVVGIPAS